MNKEAIIEKVRQLIHPGYKTAILARIYLENQEWTDSNMYRDAIKAISLMEQIRNELGYKEDEIQEGTTLKQNKLPFT